MAASWSEPVHCPDCDSDDTTYLRDEESGDATYEVFVCEKCGRRIYVELPD